MKNEPLFTIDYEHWSLPVSTETGLPAEPVKPRDFEGYSYWDAQYRGPIRQIREKGRPNTYGDSLVAASGTLERSVIGTLDVSPYDTEISEEQYYELCQTTLMKLRYRKLVDTEVLSPFQALSLKYVKIGEEPIIKLRGRAYRLNPTGQALEQAEIDLQSGSEISEHDYYYLALVELINVHGQDKVLVLEPHIRRRVSFTIGSDRYVPCDNCEAHAITELENASYTCQHCGHIGKVPS